MLHILFMILKIISVIIAIILGILILLLLIALFVPLRYRIDGMCDNRGMESLEVRVKFSWLLHLFAGYFVYGNQVSDWQARFAWRKFHVPGKETDDSFDEHLSEEPRKESSAEKKRTEDARDVCEEAGKELDKEPEIISSKEQEQDRNQNDRRIIRKGLGNKIKSFFQKIKYTFMQICDKMKILIEKKERLLEFMEHEMHKSAFAGTKTEVLRLLKFLKPAKIRGRIHFGFEDPCLTGQMLAGASMLYPLYGNRLTVWPDFEENVLEGEVHIKGRVRGLHAAIIVWNLIVNKDIRTTYKHIKEFQL